MFLNVKVENTGPVLEELRKLNPKGKIPRALRAGADYLAEKLRRDLGRVSRRMGTSVEVRRLGETQIEVGLGKRAWFAHFLEGGTRAHDIFATRARVLASPWQVYGTHVHVSGVQAGHYFANSVGQNVDDAMNEIIKTYLRY